MTTLSGKERQLQLKVQGKDSLKEKDFLEDKISCGRTRWSMIWRRWGVLNTEKDGRNILVRPNTILDMNIHSRKLIWRILYSNSNTQ